MMAFICGMVIGGMLGVTVAALCAVGGDEASCLLVDIHAAIIRG